MTDLGPGQARRWWLPLVAAGTVVVVAAGVVVALGSRGGERTSAAARARAGAADDVVRDGDRVAGRGLVIARPGRPVQLCASAMILDVLPPRLGGLCRAPLTVTGVDLNRLTGREETDGTVWGTAKVEGVFRRGALTVAAQDADQPGPRYDPTAPDPVPCPEPAGGWPRQPADAERLVLALTTAVRQHAGTYNGPWVAYPYGWHRQDTSDRKGTEVYVVGTTGDVAAARTELAAVVPAEHFCVTRVRWSKAAMDAAQSRVTSRKAQAAGVSGGFSDLLADRVTAELVVLDEPASRFLAGVVGAVPEPLLRKVG